MDRQVKLAGIRLSYLVDLVSQAMAFKVWLDADDFETIAKHAHRIKGTAGTYRLGDVAAVMAEIEELAAASDGQAIAGKLKEVAGLIDMQKRLVEQTHEELTRNHRQEKTDG